MSRSKAAEKEAPSTGGPDGPWRSRITGSGEEDPTQLLANPRNWRTHPNTQREAMRGALGEVGWVQQVVVNTTTGHVVDGHLRVEEAISAGAPTVPVLYVELSADEEAVVLATLDPLAAMAGQTHEQLQGLLAEITVDDAALTKMLARMERATEDAYSGQIKVPRYEPTGEEPAPKQLWDDTKAEELRAAVRAAELEDPIRDFLLAAAGRHTIFDYGQIAEYYAHASAQIQRLMEASALVILDYEDAIRDGYVRFTEAVAALEELDNGEA